MMEIWLFPIPIYSKNNFTKKTAAVQQNLQETAGTQIRSSNKISSFQAIFDRLDPGKRYNAFCTANWL